MLPASAVIKRLRIDPYVLSLLATLGIAALLPARGGVAEGLDQSIDIAIGLLFFLYGARLSTRSALDSLRDWRLHLLILGMTFVVFPVLGLASSLLVPVVLSPVLLAGVLFLCALPSAVQSSITFTSTAQGSVASAVCGASFSNLLGVVLTPLLVGVLSVGSDGGFSLGSMRDVMLRLLLPFLLGQVAHRWIGRWVRRHRKPLGLLERGVILLAVYIAFSRGVVSGIWQEVGPRQLALLVLVAAVLLALALTTTASVSRWLGFAREERIAIVFCGSQKSLASGLPIATVLFADDQVGLLVLPLMLYHQMQLITCAWLAGRYADKAPRSAATEKSEVPTQSSGQRSS